MTLFLRKNFLNTDFTIHRESFGKYDCAIALKGKKKPENPVVLYELKTYVKHKEKLGATSTSKTLLKDLSKLRNGIAKYDKARGYFLLVVKKEDVEKDLPAELSFIKNHWEGSKKWHLLEFDKKKVRIRPSSKEGVRRIIVFSWEVK